VLQTTQQLIWSAIFIRHGHGTFEAGWRVFWAAAVWRQYQLISFSSMHITGGLITFAGRIA
jgi:hypothetical protein